MVRGFSCSEACGIFLDQGLNPCLLHTSYLPRFTRKSPLVVFIHYLGEQTLGKEWKRKSVAFPTLNPKVGRDWEQCSEAQLGTIHLLESPFHETVSNLHPSSLASFPHPAPLISYFSIPFPKHTMHSLVFGESKVPYSLGRLEQ